LHSEPFLGNDASSGSRSTLSSRRAVRLPFARKPWQNAKGGTDATPVGMAVTARIELVSVEGRSLLFKVACHDEAGLIGEGTHRRAIVDAARFAETLRMEQSFSPDGGRHWEVNWICELSR